MTNILCRKVGNYVEYFIADLHFGHRQIIEFERHQFSDIHEHDLYFLQMLKKEVQKDDTLYVLGDFAMTITDDVGQLFKELPFKKILIKGNHDARNNEYYLNYFDEVYKFPIYLSNRIVLSHYPIPVTNGTLNLHGHIHNGYLESKNHVNVNMKLMSRKEVDKLVKGLPKDNYKFLHEWYIDMQRTTLTQQKDAVIVDGKYDVKASLEKRKLLEEEEAFKSMIVE